MYLSTKAPLRTGQYRQRWLLRLFSVGPRLPPCLGTLVAMVSLRGNACRALVLLILPCYVVAQVRDASLLVVYSYYHSPSLLHPDVDNLIFFINTAVSCNHSFVRYVFLFAADHVEDAKASFHLSPFYQAIPPWFHKSSNIQLEWIENGDYDLCNYKRAFSADWFRRATMRVRWFFFVNATVRGPFVPMYAKKGTAWWDPFLQLMHDDVSLVGSYLNCEVAPHVQSFAILLDVNGLAVAERTWNCPPSDIRRSVTVKSKWIAETEVALSRNIIAQGRSFRSLLMSHYGVDGRHLGSTVSCALTNPTLYHNYFGTTPSPYEVIFYKCGGDVRRENGLPEHAAALLDIYSRAEAKQWPHEPARLWFSNGCSQPRPSTNAACLDDRWVITGSWVVDRRVSVKGHLRVLGSLTVLSRGEITMDLSSNSFPLVVRDGASINGDLLLSVPRDALLPRTFKVLQAGHTISWSGRLKVVEGITPCTHHSVAILECNDQCLSVRIDACIEQSLLFFHLTSAVLCILLFFVCSALRRRVTRIRGRSIAPRVPTEM